MAEGESQKPTEGVAQTLPGPKLDADLPQWLRYIGAIVTILGALAGIGFTTYQLRMKADSDTETAKLNRDAERDKLELGKTQIAATNRQHEEDNQQHAKDKDLEMDKAKRELQHLIDQEKAAEVRDQRNRLSALITKMFSETGSREGDLASLFEFLTNDPGARKIIENATLAKLENPRSKGEIDIAFRILEQEDLSAIKSVILANCSARRRYDSYLSSEVNYFLSDTKSWSDPGVNIKAFTLVASAKALNAVKTVDSLYSYKRAIINSASEIFIPESIDSPKPKEPDKNDLNLSEAIIERSNASIVELLKRANENRNFGSVDLSTSFLTDASVNQIMISAKERRFSCDACTVEIRSIPGAYTDYGSYVNDLSHVLPGAVIALGGKLVSLQESLRDLGPRP